MLVLTRRPGESIIIGKNLIKIKVLNSNSYNVRLGIDAPKELSVHREEIYHCIENGTRPKEKVERTIQNGDDKTIKEINFNK